MRSKVTLKFDFWNFSDSRSYDRPANTRRTEFCIPDLNGKFCIGSVAVVIANNIGTDISESVKTSVWLVSSRMKFLFVKFCGI